jgi:hypothetical protein
MNGQIYCKHSVRDFSDEKVEECLDIIKNRIVLNDNTRLLVFIKYGELHVLNSLKPIIAEICDCLIIRNTQAAITLTNHLFENVLKQALIIWDSQGRTLNDVQQIEKLFEHEVEEYDNRDLEPNINKCKSKGLISKDESNRLKKLKDIYRNSFSHASYSRLFKNASTIMYSASYKNPTDIKEESVAISKVPFLYLRAQEEFAKQNAFHYFTEIYTFVNDMDEKLLDLYPDVKGFVEKEKMKRIRENHKE